MSLQHGHKYTLRIYFNDRIILITSLAFSNVVSFRLPGASLIGSACSHNHSIPVYGRSSGGASSKTEKKKIKTTSVISFMKRLL